MVRVLPVSHENIQLPGGHKGGKLGHGGIAVLRSRVPIGDEHGFRVDRFLFAEFHEGVKILLQDGGVKFLG